MTEASRTPSNIYPSLTYDDAAKAIDWLCHAFGFRKRLVVPGPNGSIAHAELSLGPGVVMVHSSEPERRRLSPRALPGVHQSVRIRVEDPDRHFACAKRAGATIVQEICDEAQGQRGYAARDLEGHEWYFGTYRPGAAWEGPPA